METSPFACEVELTIYNIASDRWHTTPIAIPNGWPEVDGYSVTLGEGEREGQTAVATARYAAGNPPTVSLRGRSPFT